MSRLGRFQAQEPEINLRLSPSIDLSTFADSDLDLCIRLGRGQYAGLKSHLHVADSTSLVEALLSCQGLAMMRYGLVYELIEKGQLICPLPIYMKSQYDFYLVAPAPHFKYQKVMTFKRWIEQEVKAIDSSWAMYLKTHPEMSEVAV